MTVEFLNEVKEELVGKEMTVLDLSNKLQVLGCEDICDFGGLEECIEDENVVVATDECGEEHIQVYYDVIITAGDDELITAAYVKITDVEEF